MVCDETAGGDSLEREEVVGQSTGQDRHDAALEYLSGERLKMLSTISRIDPVMALETELAQANLSLYLRLTPMEQIQWPQVAEEMDRLDRQRDGRLLHEGD
jgi:hypothetical protein